MQSKPAPPPLFRDPTVWCSEATKSTPLGFPHTVLHYSNLYKVDETFRQNPKAGKQDRTKPYLGFSSPPFRVRPLRTAASPTSRGRAQEHLSWQTVLAIWSLPFMWCLGLCLLNSFLILLKEAQPPKAGVIGIADETFDCRHKWGSHRPHTDKYANSCKSPESLNVQRFYIYTFKDEDAQGQKTRVFLAVIWENPPGEQHSSLERCFIYSYLSRSLQRAAESLPWQLGNQGWSDHWGVYCIVLFGEENSCFKWFLLPKFPQKAKLPFHRSFVWDIL